eukprot:CAMPEP_0168537066 /NCGR_PEP_ID=MMETSP0405-20121227/20057_1 /TAXON_ID=498012 /ORGANISM="Trichosphaerium sp, Strain Am-I-7 wt" /LENGTH=440 /DNA_ID=CAMNT_0008565459 /DNA_START=476 /DNA_END=1798 /DNA_ORIENTATION=+
MKIVWSRGIDIEGNLTLAAAINSSLYDIVSNMRPDWPYSTSPGGIANNAYHGHTFWDSETWMYPTLLLFFPDIAKSMLEYRFLRLEEAMKKALWSGHKGASFPWESAFTGYECTCCAPINIEGIEEIHITGDIAFAFIQYYYATKDLTWLRTTAWPVLYQIAEFWNSRAILKDGVYNINDVQCPDESSTHVNNSIYTNVVASRSLEFASYAAKILGKQENPQWLIVAKNVKIPFDSKNQIHLQYDGYNGHTINQADVVLLQYPLRYQMTKEVATNDIKYYQNVTQNNGMFTGDATYSIANLRLGLYKEALQFYDLSFPHIKPPFNVWQERIVGGNYHFITGAGGFLQNIVFGYAGFDLNPTNFSMNPILPPGQVTVVTLRGLHYLDNILDISYDTKNITISRQNVGSKLIVEYDDGHKAELHDHLSFSVQPFIVTDSDNN